VIDTMNRTAAVFAAEKEFGAPADGGGHELDEDGGRRQRAAGKIGGKWKQKVFSFKKKK
jgi:hypothetical protein